MKEFDLLKQQGEYIAKAIKTETGKIPEKYCYSCGWRLHEDEIKDDCIRQYCENCRETIEKDDIENKIDDMRLDKKLKINK